MIIEDLLYLASFVGSPVLLGLYWWGWGRRQHIQLPKWRAATFLSGLCAATGNFIVLWVWVIWLRFHYNPSSGRMRDVVGDVGLSLLLYSICAAIAGKGRYRILLAVSGTLAMLPWLSVGV